METLNNLTKANTIDKFLKFSYNFPLDIEQRFITHFGESLGNHFYEKFKGFTKKHGNNFIGMIYTFADMTKGNQIKFIELMETYYSELDI